MSRPPRRDRHREGDVVFDKRGVIVYQPQVNTEFGAFKVYLRTDWKYGVWDRRRHWADLPLHLFTKVGPALRKAEELWNAEGRPEWSQ